MSEKISIKNFGGLKDIEFEFKAINILIGHQASGKSVVVKLMYFFKGFINDIAQNIGEENYFDSFRKIQLNKFELYFPQHTWHDEYFEIQYFLQENMNIKVIGKKDKDLRIIYSQTIEELANKIKEIHTQEHARGLPMKKANFHFMESVGYYIFTNVLSNLNQVFIPAGRSFFAQIQKNIFSLINYNIDLDPFLVEFGAYYEEYRNTKENINSKFVNRILNSKHLRKNNRDYLIHSDLRKIDISHASSAQQETLPLLIMLNAMQQEIAYIGGATVYIEEPETHLFPTAQKQIVEFIAQTFNSKNNIFQIFITTHSPYILSAFNNLIEAGNIIADNKVKAEEVYKVIPKEEILNHENFTAYSLKNGQKENLLDPETNLIGESALDEVSDEIAIEFGKLLDIDY